MGKKKDYEEWGKLEVLSGRANKMGGKKKSDTPSSHVYETGLKVM